MKNGKARAKTRSQNFFRSKIQIQIQNFRRPKPRWSEEVPVKKLQKKNSPFQELHDNQRTSHVLMSKHTPLRISYMLTYE